jgi:predicted nucleic acid-binding protein
MLAVDTNVLVYAHRREAPEHDAALALLRSLAEGRGHGRSRGRASTSSSVFPELAVEDPFS